MGTWREVGDGVFVRRYAFLDQNIGAIVGDDGVLLVDTRSVPRHAEEVVRDLASITRLPVVHVVDTHEHWDHTWGNAMFRGTPTWAHERCAEALRTLGGDALAEATATLAARYPELADDLRDLEIVVPDRTIDDLTTVRWPGREVELRYLGRGHTDNDIAVVVPDRRGSGGPVVFAGDLLENGAPPWFGDGFPIDWATTVGALLALGGDTFVPGHGAVGDRASTEAQAADIAAVAGLARDVHADELTLDEAVAAGPFPPETMTEALGRALLQLRGELP